MKADIEQVRKQIFENLDHQRFILDSDRVRFGDFLASGLTVTGERVIGYVVQVRKKWGAFGSDMYFIRLPDGRLITHENQAFWKLTKEQIDMVRPFFKYTPEEEQEDNPDHSYSIRKEQLESGFFVDDRNAPKRVDGFAIAISSNETRIFI